MTRKLSIGIVLSVVAGLIISACSPTEVVLSQNDPNTVANRGRVTVPEGLQCPNPIAVNEVDDWGIQEEIVLCNGHSLSELAGAVPYRADLALVGIAVLDPMPGDEIIAIAYTGVRLVIVWVAGVTAAKYAADGLVAMARHTGEHRPYQDPQANTLVIGVLELIKTGQAGFLPPGQQNPGSRLLCYAVRYGEQTIRIAVHAILDPASGIGATVVINPLTPQTPYLSAFESSRENFLAGDHITRFQKSYPGASWEEADCSQLPAGPTPLAP